MLNRTISITEEQWDKVEATMVKYNEWDEHIFVCYRKVVRE